MIAIAPLLKQQLVEEMKALPKQWVFTPVAEKRPNRSGWQTENLSRLEVVNLVKRDARYTGFGLITGTLSGGLIALDVDGASAEPVLKAVAGGSYPETVSWTSGKPGRKQLLYQIPAEHLDTLKDFTRHVITEHDGVQSGAGEQLELRYNRHQSVLPPSVHPETGAYQWINSPTDIEIAIAPQWLIDTAISGAKAEYEAKAQKQAKRARQQTVQEYQSDDSFDIRNFQHLLDGYSKGRCKCPHHNGTSFTSLSIDQKTGAFHCFNECNTKDVYSAALDLAVSRGYPDPRSAKSNNSSSDYLTYVNKLDKADRQQWYEDEQIEVAIADEEKAQLLAHLETKRQSALRIEVKLNAAAAAVKAQAKIKDDVVVVSSHEEGIRIGLELGKRVFGNASGTGQGKSQGDAQLTVEKLKAMGIDVNRKISVLPDPLNPPNPIYQEHYTLVPGRHLGTYTDPQSGKKRRVKDNTTAIPFEPANCKFAGTPIFSPQLQCMACSHRHRCGTERGDGYGARFEAHEALRYPNNIMSVGRLPHPGTEDMNLLTEAWLTIDEAPQVVEIAKTTHVEPIDIHRKEDQLEQESPEIAAQFKPLLDYLKAAQWQQSSDFNPVHGVPLAAVHNELLDTLWDLIPADENGLIWIGEPGDIPINWDELYDIEDTYAEQQRLIFGDKAEKLTQTECNRLQRLKKKQVPNPENDRQWRVLEAKLEQAGKLNQDDRKALNLYRSTYLSQNEEYELAKLSERHEATKFQPPSPAELRNKSAQVTKPWLHDCLQVVTGTVPGNITFNADGSFDVTIKNEHHIGAIAAAKHVELMSADLPRTNIAVAQQFGCDADEVFLFEVNPAKANGLSDGDKPSNLKVVQVASLGAMGRQRGAAYETAKQITVAQLENDNPDKHRHYDFKEFDRNKTHFIENSSDNEPFESGVTSISMSPPRPSMKGVLSTYCTLTGQIVGFDDPGYQEYYQEQLRKLIDQTKGRFRRQWRSDEQFILYIFSDEELPIVVDKVISASTITEKAAVGREVLFYKLPRAIADIALDGGKLTQKAIAAALSCTQARVSQICAAIPGGWKIFKAIFCQLFGISQSSPDGNINSSIEECREVYKTEIPSAELDDFIQFVTAIVEMYHEGTYSAEEVVKEVIKIALNVGGKLWRAVTASMPPELRSQLQSIVLESYPKIPKWLRGKPTNPSPT